MKLLVKDKCCQKNKNMDLKSSKMVQIFLLGPGGSGKHFIKQILLSSNPQTTQICALTGCATILLQAENEKASTIHSWSGVGIGKGEWNDILKKIKKNREVKNRWLRLLF